MELLHYVNLLKEKAPVDLDLDLQYSKHIFILV